MINAKTLVIISVYCLLMRYQCKSTISNRKLISNQNAFDQICTKDNYSNPELNKLYSTANSYININYKNANDDTKNSRTFYLDLISTGKVGKLNNFFEGGSIGYAFLLAVACGVLATWITFGILWYNNCCLFIKEHDSTQCQSAPYIVITTLFGLVVILLIISLVLSNLASKEFQKGICSLLRLSFEGINGKGDKAVALDWPGTSKVKASLEATKGIIDKFSSDYASSFLLFSQITADAQDFEDSITSYEIDYGQFKLQSPNAESSNQILPLFLNNYSPVTSSDKTLYKILQEYLKNIKPSVNLLIQIENNSKQVSITSTQMKSEVEKTITEIVTLESAFNKINEKMISNTLLIHDILIDIIFVIYDVSLSFMVVISSAVIIFTSIFKYKSILNIKYLLHVFWNINFFFIAVSLIVCAFLGCFCIIGKDIIVTINYMLNTSYMGKQDAIFGFQESTANSIDTCLNSNGDLSKAINVNRVFYDYLDEIFLGTFSLYEVNDNITSITQSKSIPTENEIYIKYQGNIPTTTDDSYGQDDFTKSLYLLSRWTDTGLSNSLQPPCTMRTYDHWVANVNQCPSGYVYSPTGINLKNCLLIPNWTKQDITNRYNPACDSIEGVPIAIGARRYFDPLLDYYTSCDNLLNTLLSGNRDFSNKYESLLKKIKQETQNIKPLLDSLKSMYEPVIANNTIYQLFNCSSLKSELLVFYDQLNNQFYTKCLAIVILTTLSLLMAYTANYFFIDVIYRQEDRIINDEGMNHNSKDPEEEQSEETPEYDANNPSGAHEVNNMNNLPIFKKKEEEDFEYNPMYDFLAGDRRLKTNIDKNENEEGQSNKLTLNLNLNKNFNTVKINSQPQESQHNNLL